MEFVICEDQQKNTSAVKIHLKSCYYYTHHDEPTDTTVWYDTDSYEHAKILSERLAHDCTKGWRNAKCCTEKVMTGYE